MTCSVVHSVPKFSEAWCLCFLLGLHTRTESALPTITHHYGITGPVPFIDVDVADDTRLYLDPHRIRLHSAPQPFADQALECIDTFMQEVVDSVIARTAESHRRGEGLLQHFVEPRETRLGMSRVGFDGHGGAKTVGTWIWDVLFREVTPLIRVGVLKHIGELPLFVKGVDRDITSDITTRLVLEPLARFTELMCATYPQFAASGHEVRTFRKQVWNPDDREWDEAEMALPVVDGAPLVLVPREWARRTLLMSAGRYYGTSVLTFAQLERAVRGHDGRLITTSKDRLMKQPDLVRGRGTNQRITLRAHEKGEDLLAHFKAYVAEYLKKHEQEARPSA